MFELFQRWIQWCNANQGFVSTIFPLIYVVATTVIVSVMIRSNRLAISLERQRTRPVVVVEFFSEASFWSLRVKNSGQSVARDIVIEMSPEPRVCFGAGTFVARESQKAHEKRLSLFESGIPSLAASSELSALIGRLPDIESILGNLRFQGKVSYADDLGHLYSTAIDIDLAIYSPLLELRRKGLHEIGAELEKLTREVRNISSGFSKPHILVQGIDAHRRESEEQVEALLLQKEAKQNDASGETEETSSNESVEKADH